MKGYLVLENGQVFEGEKIGAFKKTALELVFNTSMVGYIETFTDPSYAGQGLVMTYPLIGNYGIIKEDNESEKIWCKAIFVHELAEYESNFRTNGTLESFLKENDIPGLKGVNTRKLTKILRSEGTMKAYLTDDISNLKKIHEEIEKYEVGNWVEEVSCTKPQKYNKNSEKQIAFIDYGYRKNILDEFLKRGIGVTVYPSTTTAEEILKDNPDGIMLSNGPSNPVECKFQIENIKKLYDSDKPIFGICLGHQLMALATGAKTAKLKYGHRGANHPVKELSTDKIYITSQNHGYYVDAESVNPDIAEVSHISLNDGSVEGLKYKNKKIFTVQFHPVSCSGPQDTAYLFDKFIEMI